MARPNPLPECEESNLLRRDLSRLNDETEEKLDALNRRVRRLQRARGMDIEDTGSHRAITVPGRRIVIEPDAIPSPAEIVRPSRAR